MALSLRESGHDVVLFVRRPESVRDLGEGFEVRAGDLLDRASLERGVEGCDAIVHIAGLVKRWVRDPSIFDRVNVEATASLMDIARDRGVARFVYCSSFFALGPTDGRRNANETLLHDGRPRTDYERTKLQAEGLVRHRQEAGLPIVIVYPGVVYGPGRLTEGNLMAGIARDLLTGELPGMIGPGDRQQCLSHVEDVARGFVLALEKAEPGTRYILGGDNLTVRQILSIMGKAGGVRPPRRVIPYALASLIGKIYRWRAQLTGAEPKLTDEEVETYKHSWAYDSSRARQELGYSTRRAEDGLIAMVDWLIESGHVPRPAGGREHARS